MSSVDFLQNRLLIKNGHKEMNEKIELGILNNFSDSCIQFAQDTKFFKTTVTEYIRSYWVLVSVRAYYTVWKGKREWILFLGSILYHMIV